MGVYIIFTLMVSLAVTITKTLEAVVENAQTDEIMNVIEQKVIKLKVLKINGGSAI